jgi:hypothetical protein
MMTIVISNRCAGTCRGTRVAIYGALFRDVDHEPTLLLSLNPPHGVQSTELSTS